MDLPISEHIQCPTTIEDFLYLKSLNLLAMVRVSLSLMDVIVRFYSIGLIESLIFNKEICKKWQCFWSMQCHGNMPGIFFFVMWLAILSMREIEINFYQRRSLPARCDEEARPASQLGTSWLLLLSIPRLDSKIVRCRSFSRVWRAGLTRVAWRLPATFKSLSPRSWENFLLRDTAQYWMRSTRTSLHSCPVQNCTRRREECWPLVRFADSASVCCSTGWGSHIVHP